MSLSLNLIEIDRHGLATPHLNTSPLPDYDEDHLDYGMTIGIEHTPSGRLWACWVGGGDNDKAFFVLATSDDAGKSWSPPRLVIDPHDSSLPYPRRTIVGNLWTDPDGRLWLFFDQSLGYFDGRGGTWATRCDHPDAAEPVWTTPERIWHGCALNKPIVLANGDWLMTISLWDQSRIRIGQETSALQAELDEFRMANVFVSTDKGQHWQRRGGVRFPDPEFDEAQVIERRDGSFWMTGRTKYALHESVSRDRGTTWSEPVVSKIATTNSRHHLRRLASGRLLLVKHGQTPNARPNSEHLGVRGRSWLTAFVSEDDGASWLGGLVLDERANVSYPDGTQEPDDSILISYDFNRHTHGEILFARFTEADVLASRGISPGFALRQLISRPKAIAARLAKEGH